MSPREKISDTKIAAWAQFLSAHRMALGQVEQALKAENLPPLSWYDALLELHGAPEGLRATELEARMLLPQYNISRLVDRLERAGMIERAADPDDARARVLGLTKAGREMMRRMWPVYSDAIQRSFADRLTESEAKAMRGLFGKILCK